MLGQSRSTQRYHRRQPDDERRLIEELRRWCECYPRFGSERVHQLLVGTGWRVNFKRVHRLWKQEHLQVPAKQRKKRRLPGGSANKRGENEPESSPWDCMVAPILWLASDDSREVSGEVFAGTEFKLEEHV